MLRANLKLDPLKVNWTTYATVVAVQRKKTEDQFPQMRQGKLTLTKIYIKLFYYETSLSKL